MNVKRFLIFWSTLLLLATCSFAQESPSVPAVKRIQFWTIGSVEVPCDYEAKIIDARRDAPYGFIASKDGKVKIGFSYGMVARVINAENEKDFTWIRSMLVDSRQFRYGLIVKNGKMTVAGHNSVNFRQEIEKEEEIELFLKIIKTFKFGRCDECERPSLLKQPTK